ncbi:MAG: hypothetical protein JNM70_02110 [Anaerolineae bacterium]|nr:hypothetical protein [Anaerolineae bacterium]
MHIKLEFELSFISDWHINAGYGADGAADAMLERGADGRPLISGATLKGLFREAVYDLACNLNAKLDEKTLKKTAEKWANDLLGAPGLDSRWRFSAATRSSRRRTEAQRLATGVRVDPRYRRAEDNKYFIRELGTAEVYQFTVEGQVGEDVWLDEVERLAAAAAYIQRLGGRRRRGSGACRIQLRNLPNVDLNAALLGHYVGSIQGKAEPLNDSLVREAIEVIRSAPAESYAHENPSRRYRLLLYTQRPVIVAQKPQSGNVYLGDNTIPGSSIRGAFAALAQPNSLQKDRYRQFVELFIGGGLHFSLLLPLVKPFEDAAAGLGVPAVPPPLGLQQVEGSEDSFTSVFHHGITKKKAFKKWKKLADGARDEVAPTFKTEPHPHVGIHPGLKRADDGDLYLYDTIPAGQTFVGEITLNQEDWESLGSLIGVAVGEDFDLYLGKGRNRGYGHCKARIEPVTEDQPPPWVHMPLEKRLDVRPAPNELLMTLASDTILLDKWGAYYRCFDQDWLEDVFGVQVIIPEENQIASQVVQTRSIESFDARSGLPRWRDLALATGSTVRLRFPVQFPDPDRLRDLERDGIGLRRSEGFGRVVFNHPAHIGDWQGFASPLSIPEGLFNPVVKSNNDETFRQNWLGLLDRAFDQKQFKDGRVLRAVARQLVEMRGQRIPEVLQTFQNLLEQAQAASERQAYKDYRSVVQVVAGLLQKLIDDDIKPRYTRPALLVLAERLHTLAQKQED